MYDLESLNILAHHVANQANEPGLHRVAKNGTTTNVTQMTSYTTGSSKSFFSPLFGFRARRYDTVQSRISKTLKFDSSRLFSFLQIDRGLQASDRSSSSLFHFASSVISTMAFNSYKD